MTHWGRPRPGRGDVPAATAASLLVRRSAFESVGRFSGGYDYGMEDVDLCLKLRERGWRIVYEPQATFWHDESATQRQQASTARRTRQQRNRELLQDRWGPRLFREVMLDRLSHGGRWSEATLHVALTVTRDDASAAFGDWYTAHELGDALATFGWRISYLERWHDHWYEPDPSIDVVIVLLDMMDIRRLHDGVVTVAWVRNWTDRWLSQPWFDEFDIVLASSERSKGLIDDASVHVAHVMPLATNPARFRTGVRPAEPPVDVLFAGNRWGPPRRVEGVLHDLVARGWSVALFGTGWEQVPRLSALARGALPYDRLPAAYASAAVVVDDAGLSTRPYGSVNSRVFDALAVGAMVVSDDALGGKELFGGLLPVADTPAELVGIIEKQLRDPGRQARAQRLQEVVLGRHTYHHRAVELREILRDWALARRLDLAIAPQSWEVAETWGDYHFARGLQRQFQRRGHPTRLRLRASWESRPAARADVSLQLMGRGTRRIRPGQLSVLWIISHPDLVTDDIVLANDLVFAASDRFARRLAERTGRAVLPLHQATDPARFRPMSGGVVHELLFVANSRYQRRPVTDALDRTPHDFAVYGENWKPGLVDPRHVRGHHIPNAALASYYSAAAIVLNDHWPDMAAQGFLSNRLYDASACGAFVISDHVEGIDTEFDGGIITFRDADELREQVERFLQDPEARAANAERAYKAVLARHTLEDRVEQLLATIGPLAETRPARLSTDGAQIDRRR